MQNVLHKKRLPATQLRSSKPSIRSIISADDVRATAKKNTILETIKVLLLAAYLGIRVSKLPHISLTTYLPASQI